MLNCANELTVYLRLVLCTVTHSAFYLFIYLLLACFAISKFVINPSGGLESKGHPLGATGIGMLFYLTLQLRGEAGELQVPNVQHALAHNIGLGGSCIVTILRRPEFYQSSRPVAAGGGESPMHARLGYHVARECRPITQADLDKVKSRLYSNYVEPALPEVEDGALNAKL